MKKVAQYALTGVTGDSTQAKSLFHQACHAVSCWLQAKNLPSGQSGSFLQPDGRRFDVEFTAWTCRSGTLNRWLLTELSETGRFSTTLGLANAGEEVAFTCSLSTGAAVTSVTPGRFIARCPQVVRTILELKPGWRLGETTVHSNSLRVSSSEEANVLVKRILSPTRTLPIVVASRWDGLLLHPNIADALAADICALGLVVDLEAEAAWVTTRQLGADWSCYNGAIRIYWPHLDTTRQAPRIHPLWTSERLMYQVTSTEEASRRIRTVIRNRLFSASAFAVQEPPIFDKLQNERGKEALAEKLTLATSVEDYKAIAESYAKENDELRQQLQEQRTYVEQLRYDLGQAQLVKAYAEDDEEVAPNEDTPPDSVDKAVSCAKKLYSQQLTFGKDVARGVQGLAPNAGPPNKLLDYLRILASLVDQRRACSATATSLGNTMTQWLCNKGAIASDESETIRNNRDEMKKRTWHDGRAQRKFKLHLKPVEATSPDCCVRIYFDWDDASAKVVVGWIGRHP